MKDLFDDKIIEPKYIYVKLKKEFDSQINYFNGTVFWREILDNDGNRTDWVEIKIAINHKFNDGTTVAQRVRKLKGGWYENKK